MQSNYIHTSDQLPLVIGVDLGGTQFRTAVLHGSNLLSRVSSLTGENPSPERIIPRIFTAVQQALEQAGTTLNQIAGIGVAAPGPLDHGTGVIFDPPNLPGWKRVPVRDLFTERFHIPVFVENDAHSAGMGEYMFGAGRGCNNIVYMTISTGIGGGVIINGRIVEGANGTAGELGHMSIDWRGERCNCGNIGCLEYIASGTSIARKANEAIRSGEGIELLTFARILLERSSEEDLHVNARTVALAAEAGLPLARSIIQNAAEAIGVGLVNIIHGFNPEMIILGGGVTQMGPMLMEPALRVVQERAMKVPRESVRIVQAQLGANVGLIGAGALIYYYNNERAF
jgi:glucokinase